MFECKFTPLVVNAHPRVINKVRSVKLFSEECEKLGLHPAQGIRLANRWFYDDKVQLECQPTSAAAAELAYAIHKKLKPAPRTVSSVTPQHPEHFLLNTRIPANINTIAGYTSPIQDIQPDVHFIRTQRRYNKRRYARVRAVSRPSFWSGMMLSTVATGAFWGSTIQMTDWLTTGPINPDPSLILLLGTIVLIRKIWRLYAYAGSPKYREFNFARKNWTRYLPIN